MKIKIIKNTVFDGSVWIVGDVVEISDDTAQAVIKRGDAVAVDEMEVGIRLDKKK